MAAALRRAVGVKTTRPGHIPVFFCAYDFSFISPSIRLTPARREFARRAVRVSVSGLALQIDTQKRLPPVSVFPTNRVGEKSARQVKFTRGALPCLHYFLFLGYHRGAVPLRDA
jgi:hypothetical protein